MSRSLRIVTWNCWQKLRAKLPDLESLSPDIAIVPECCTPELLRNEAPLLMPKSAAWVGDNDRQGLGVFGFGDYTVELDESFDSELTWIAPVRVSGPVDFHLLAICVPSAKAKRGMSPILRALDQLGEFVHNKSLVVAGDFNHNAQSDGDSSWSQKHMPTVTALNELGLVSSYHETRGEPQGEETEPTSFQHKHSDKPFHIDYCFVPQSWRIKEHTIGDPKQWLKLSDHLPLLTVCEVE